MSFAVNAWSETNWHWVHVYSMFIAFYIYRSFGSNYLFSDVLTSYLIIILPFGKLIVTLNNRFKLHILGITGCNCSSGAIYFLKRKYYYTGSKPSSPKKASREYYWFKMLNNQFRDSLYALLPSQSKKSYTSIYIVMLLLIKGTWLNKK